MKRSQLTAVILTLNEARHITACIESPRWADHILVVDSYSRDATVNLARQASAEVGLLSGSVRDRPQLADMDQHRNTGIKNC